MTKEFKPESYHSAKTHLNIYSASNIASTVRLEDYGLSFILYINERSYTSATKPDLQTLICLRDVLNRWHESFKAGD